MGRGSSMNRRNVLDLDTWATRGTRILDEIQGIDVFADVDTTAPWSATSLNAAEQRMLTTWTSADDIRAEVRAQYEIFLGEGLRRRFNGSWARLEPEFLGETTPDTPIGVGIAYPDESIDVVSSLVPQAFRNGTGTWWSTIFQATQELLSTGTQPGTDRR